MLTERKKGNQEKNVRCLYQACLVETEMMSHPFYIPPLLLLLLLTFALPYSHLLEASTDASLLSTSASVERRHMISSFCSCTFFSRSPTRSRRLWFSFSIISSGTQKTAALSAVTGDAAVMGLRWCWGRRGW